MNFQNSMEQRQAQAVKFLLPDREPVNRPAIIPICKTNEAFKSICEKLVEDTRNNLNEVSVNLALLTLQEKFFSCFELAPKGCRKHMFSDKVICLHSSYRETYIQLHELRLQTTPVRFRAETPPPAPITNVYRYEGFALGQTIDLNEAEAS